MKLLKVLVATLLFLLLGFFLVGILVPTVGYTVSIVVDRQVETTFDVYIDTERLDPFAEEVTALDQNVFFELITHHQTLDNTVRYEFREEDLQTVIDVTSETKGTNWIWRSLLPMMKSTLFKQQRETINRLALEAETARPTLSGSWTGADGNGNEQRFSFSRDGSVTWQVNVAGVTTVTGIHYDVDYTASPYRLDLSGFTSGPLAGLWLYGILEFEGDNSIRFDAGAGVPDDDTARPSTFSASTVTYDRIK